MNICFDNYYLKLANKRIIVFQVSLNFDPMNTENAISNLHFNDERDYYEVAKMKSFAPLFSTIERN